MAVPETIDSSQVSHQEDTVHIDSEKARAAKGDDSDGRVNWTWKQIIAVISLCGVYVGRIH